MFLRRLGSSQVVTVGLHRTGTLGIGRSGAFWIGSRFCFDRLGCFQPFHTETGHVGLPLDVCLQAFNLVPGEGQVEPVPQVELGIYPGLFFQLLVDGLVPVEAPDAEIQQGIGNAAAIEGAQASEGKPGCMAAHRVRLQHRHLHPLPGQEQRR